MPEVNIFFSNVFLAVNMIILSGSQNKLSYKKVYSFAPFFRVSLESKGLASAVSVIILSEKNINNPLCFPTLTKRLSEPKMFRLFFALFLVFILRSFASQNKSTNNVSLCSSLSPKRRTQDHHLTPVHLCSERN